MNDQLKERVAMDLKKNEKGAKGVKVPKEEVNMGTTEESQELEGIFMNVMDELNL